MPDRYKVVKGGPYPHLITCTIVRWYPVFLSVPYFDLITQSLKHLRENRDLLLYAYVIMPTHLHLIAAAVKDDLSDIIRDFKKFTSRRIYDLAESDGNDLMTWLFRKAAEKDQRSRFKVWQDEFHPKVIMDRDVFYQKAEYVHLNPVRKGFVDRPENWYYSSAKAYHDGKMEPLEIDLAEW